MLNPCHFMYISVCNMCLPLLLILLQFFFSFISFVGAHKCHIIVTLFFCFLSDTTICFSLFVISDEIFSLLILLCPRDDHTMNDTCLKLSEFYFNIIINTFFFASFFLSTACITHYRLKWKKK